MESRRSIQQDPPVWPDDLDTDTPGGAPTSKTVLLVPGRLGGRRSVRRYIGLTLAVLVGASVAGPAAVMAQDATNKAAATFGVVAAGQSPLGTAYPEWARRWNQWFWSLPAEGHPMLTDNCQAGQATDAFIIPPTYFGNTLVTSCEVGADQYILVVPGSISCSRDPGDTDEALLACADGARPEFSNVRVTVDGQELPMMDTFWTVSPITTVELSDDNFFGSPGGATDIVTGGWFAMLEPLTPGTHTIVAHAETKDPEAGLVAAETIATVEVAAPLDAEASSGPTA